MIPDRLPLAKRLRRRYWPVSIDREIADELNAHIALQTRRYMDQGLTEPDARRAAEARFGDIETVRGECRDIRTDMEAAMERAEMSRELRMDVDFALRTLKRNPMFAAVAVFTIALAMGANTAIFSVLEGVLLRSLPYRYADRVELIWNSHARTPAGRTSVSVPEYFDLKEQLRAHDAVAAVRPQPAPLIADGGDPERVNAYAVSPNLFDLLGASPILGRSFGGDDGTPGAPRVILISHALWTRRFGADPKVIGRLVSVSGLQRTIVGVMPPAIRFPDAPLDFLRDPADLWIPTTWQLQRGDSRGNQIIAVLARRAPGVDDAGAAADLAAVAARFRASFPERYAGEAFKLWRLEPVSLREQMVGSVRRGLFVLSAAVGLVLLIACVNVANLLLARGAARQRELAIRTALGAGRARLVRQLLTESLVLALTGGLLGLPIAWVGLRALGSLDAGQVPRMGTVHIDGGVLLFCFALSLVTGIVVGIVPAFQQSTHDVRDRLSASTHGAGDSRARHRLRSALVCAEVAMALMVLVGAGLLYRSFAALERVALGFSSRGVTTYQLTLPRTKYDSVSKMITAYQRIVAAAGAIPGVSVASAGYPLPMSGDGWSGSYAVEGEPSGPNDPVPHAEYGVALPGYFRAMGIPMVAGRDFAATDTRDAPLAVIVDESLAKKHWPKESALGRRLDINGPNTPMFTIVGVVGHVHRSGPKDDGEPQIYHPFAQNPQSTLSVVLRGTDGTIPAALAPAIRAAMRDIDHDLAIANLHTLDGDVAKGLARQRFDALLLATFALTALVLASVGLYGVMSYLVSQRTREIGIRTALGGEPAAIRRMVVREGLLISLTGLAAGGLVSVAVSGALRGLLFGVGPPDPLTYAVIAGVLVLVSLAASYGPARRATRIDPAVALRD